MEQLLTYDKQFFKFINNGLSNNFFDWLMPFLRNSTMWVPLYFFLIVFGVLNCKKNGWMWVLFAIVLVVVTNYISSNLIKGNIYRLRPCNDPSLSSYINILVGYKPQSSSFTSSHATNHFGQAMFFYLTLRHVFNKWALLFFFWAFSISFAQVYVGVHYPLDVLAGGILGCLIGYICGKQFNKNYALQ